MGSLKKRVKNLEASGAECPECGFDGDWSNVDIVVEWADLDYGEEYTGPPETTYCELCGRPTETVVVWDDLDLIHREREEQGHDN